ncbi:MAG TPA: hypothetical protein VE398_15165 [Acidobacteriota bacterium]|nr:hypothetical protein [Acidobacteriota bacterium]
MKSKLLERLLGSRSPDPGCEVCFEVLDQYVEAVLRGEDTASRFPKVVTHLLQCEACREDTEGLLAALRTDIFQSEK